MKVKNSGLKTLREHYEQLGFAEKLMLMIFGEKFSEDEWNEEWSGEKLEQLWERRNHEKFRDLASILEAKKIMQDSARDSLSDWRLIRVLLPDIWGVIKTKIDEKMLTLSELEHEFSLARLVYEFSSVVKGGPIPCESLEALIQVTQEAIWELLYILPLCRGGRHPTHAGALCLSRKVSWESKVDAGNHWEIDTRNRKSIFERFEQLTVPNELTSYELHQHLLEYGVRSDEAAIRRDSKYLQINLGIGTRGPKSAPQKSISGRKKSRTNRS
jgi:hypothetical protein